MNALAAVRGEGEHVDTSTGEVRSIGPRPGGPAFLMIGEPKELAQLFKKMSSVLADVTRVAKAGENDQQHYKYTTEADLMDEVRPLLAKHGIAFFPTVVDSDQRSGGKTRSGAEKTITRVILQCAFCCTDTGAMLISTWHGEAEDSGDKSYWKAYTGTLKYAHFKTWMVSTGDDPEQTDPEPRAEPKQESRQQERSASRQQSHPRQTKNDVKPEQTEFHVNLLRAIKSRNEALPDGYACTVGKSRTPDLKQFIKDQWALISTNVQLARKAAAALDEADKVLTRERKQEAKQGKGKGAAAPKAEKDPLQPLRAKYFALLGEKFPGLHASPDNRHDFQREAVGKESSETWEAADFEKAIAAIESGEAEKYDLPF